MTRFVDRENIKMEINAVTNTLNKLGEERDRLRNELQKLKKKLCDLDQLPLGLEEAE